LDNQDFTPLTRRRRTMMRHLQETGAPGVMYATVSVAANATRAMTDFDQLLRETVTNNADWFYISLNDLATNANSTLFEGAATVSALPAGASPTTPAPVATIAPTVPPPPSAPAPMAAPAAAPSAPTKPKAPPGDDGLKPTAIIAIVVAVIFGIFLIVCIGYQCHRKEESPVTPVGSTAAAAASRAIRIEGERPTTGIKSSASGYGSSVTANPAAVAAVAAVVSGAIDPASVASGKAPGSGDGTSQSGHSGELSSHAMSSLRQNMVSRTVVAPPGKLGIVIDTTLEGPVVHTINPGSPLEGVLFPGDIIVAIDDIDTRAMNASAITALMVRTANVRRKLTVVSEDVTN
jgi:hypothetical protein